MYEMNKNIDEMFKCDTKFIVIQKHAFYGMSKQSPDQYYLR